MQYPAPLPRRVFALPFWNILAREFHASDVPLSGGLRGWNSSPWVFPHVGNLLPSFKKAGMRPPSFHSDRRAGGLNLGVKMHRRFLPACQHDAPLGADFLRYPLDARDFAFLGVHDEAAALARPSA
jgi:hypothetical protein